MQKPEIIQSLVFFLILINSLTSCSLQNQPASRPSPSVTAAAISPSASPTGPAPLPSHHPFDTQNLELYQIINYRSTTGFQPRQCEPLSEALTISRMALHDPIDVAVSPDGQTVYVTVQRCSETDISASQSYSKVCRQGRDNFETRQFIYRLHQGKMDIVREAGSGIPPLSCVLGNDIEIDKQGNLYVVDLQQHWVYHLSPEGQLKPLVQSQEYSAEREQALFSRVDKIKGDPVEMEGPRRLQLNQDSIYWVLEAKARTFSSNFGSWRFKRFDLTNRSLSQVNEFNYNLFNTAYIYKLYLYQEILPNHPNLVPLNFDQKDALKIEDAFETTVPAPDNQGKRSFLRVRINSKGKIFGVYRNAVYQIIPYEGQHLLAGNDVETGFRDATGAEARFNRLADDFSFDAADNLYVVDQGNNAIRKITPEGTVTTVYAQK